MVLVGCQEDARVAGGGRAVVAESVRVASVPVGPGRRAVLGLRRFGRVSARCSRGRAARVAYRNVSGTSQAVAVQDGGQAASSVLDPGERLLRPGPLVGVQLWQAATIGKGRVELARITVSGGPLGLTGCLVSARGDGAKRPR